MIGQFHRQVVPVRLDADEVHRQSELLDVEVPVAVDVRHLPDLAEDDVRQL